MTKPLIVRQTTSPYGVGEDNLGLAKGDKQVVVHTLDGYRLMPFDPTLAEAVRAGRDYMRRHRNAMRELAR